VSESEGGQEGGRPIRGWPKVLRSHARRIRIPQGWRRRRVVRKLQVLVRRRTSGSEAGINRLTSSTTIVISIVHTTTITTQLIYLLESLSTMAAGFGIQLVPLKLFHSPLMFSCGSSMSSNHILLFESHFGSKLAMTGTISHPNFCLI